MTEQLYTIVNPDGTDVFTNSDIRWPLPQGDMPGKWISVDGPLKPFENGLHLCRGRNFVWQLGPSPEAIYKVEQNETERIDNFAITIVRKARLTHLVGITNREMIRLYYADFAERVLPMYESILNPITVKRFNLRNAIDGIRQYVLNSNKGEIDKLWQESLEIALTIAWDQGYDFDIDGSRFLKYLYNETVNTS